MLLWKIKIMGENEDRKKEVLKFHVIADEVKQIEKWLNKSEVFAGYCLISVKFIESMEENIISLYGYKNPYK
jgi:hypothetical protein